MIDSNHSMKNFFTSLSQPTNSDYKAAAAEGTWAYHTAKHQQSFLSNNCTSQLFKAIFPDVAKKFASARTKTASIITGVLAPYAQKKLSQTGGANSLKQFCEEMDANYSTLPTHTPTRWLTLDAVLDRMIELWEPLKAHFLSLKRPLRILENFFKSETSLIIVSFLRSTLQFFKKPLLLLQKTNALFSELANIIDSFRWKIMQRQSSKFYGASAADLLKIVNKAYAYVLT